MSRNKKLRCGITRSPNIRGLPALIETSEEAEVVGQRGSDHAGERHPVAHCSREHWLLASPAAIHGGIAEAPGFGQMPDVEHHLPHLGVGEFAS
jgi:hypothetical protein